MKFACAILAFIIVGSASAPLVADVIVLANRTGQAVAFDVRRPDGDKVSHTLPAKELISIPVTGRVGNCFWPRGRPPANVD